MIMTLLYIGIGLVVLLIIILAKWYTIVPPEFADVVVQHGKMRVFSSHPAYGTERTADNKTIAAYFKIPRKFWLFHLGMEVTRMPLKIMKIDVPNFLAFDNQRARFVVDIVAYITVKDPVVAAKRFSGGIQDLANAMSVIAQATTRDVTTKKPIREIINNRDDIIKAITPPMKEAIEHWGLDLNDVELIDFKDPSKQESGIDSHVIEDISQMIEKQINSEMRQKNAEQSKIARVKEAETDEEARKREIARDEEVSKREQEKNRLIAEKQKEATREQLEVTKVEQVKNAEIQKEKAIVIANQLREVEEINKQQKKLVGEGDRLMKEEQAKGEAAPILEKLLAEAKGKDELQKALNRFEDKAIRALVAEKIVEKDRAIGIAGADALRAAQINAFLGGGAEGEKAFDIGKALAALTVANKSAADSVLHRIAVPNDLGGGIPIAEKETPSLGKIFPK